MPFGTVKLRPSINVEFTPVLNEAGYSASNLGRFKAGLFQKLGGWTSETIYAANLSGVPKCIHAWQDINANKYLLAGTTTNLTVINNKAARAITPQTKLTNTAAFSISSGSSLVRVDDASVSEIASDDAIFFNTPVQIGNIILFGRYQVNAFLAAGAFNINAGINATSTTSTWAVPSFTTVNGSSLVTVNFNNHGLVAGDEVDFVIPTSGSGVTIEGTYTVITAATNSFTIRATTSAISATTFSMNSGAAQLVYSLVIGPQPPGLGWSVGGYSSGGYSTGSSISVQTGTPITTTDWSLDNFGAFGIATPKNGTIYYYDPNAGFQTAQIIPNAPLFNSGAFVAMPQQQIVAWGSSTEIDLGYVQDPLLVRWCDVGDFTEWTAATTNQAGSYRLSTGSYIVGATQGPQNGLLWTDIDLWAMSYIGQPLVYGFNKIGSNCGLIAQHAHATLLGNVYWMGQSNFFMMAGNGIQVIPCPVWDAVFQDLDTANQDKCVAGANTTFNEVWWFYPSKSGGTGQPDKYVKYNTNEQTWDYGTLSRTAWIDQSVLGPPIATTANGSVYQHELTEDADTVPINTSMQTGYWMLSEGEDIVFVDWILPDFKWGPFNGDQAASIQVTILAVDYPGDTPRTFGPYTVTKNSQYINTRIRSRYMAMKIESNDVGSFWRLGGVKYRFAQDGRR